MSQIMNAINKSWKRNKVETGFMGAVLLLAVLTYLKPTSTENIWSALGITALNFAVLGIIGVIIWFLVRK